MPNQNRMCFHKLELCPLLVLEHLINFVSLPSPHARLLLQIQNLRIPLGVFRQKNTTSNFMWTHGFFEYGLDVLTCHSWRISKKIGKSTWECFCVFGAVSFAGFLFWFGFLYSSQLLLSDWLRVCLYQYKIETTYVANMEWYYCLSFTMFFSLPYIFQHEIMKILLLYTDFLYREKLAQRDPFF